MRGAAYFVEKVGNRCPFVLIDAGAMGGASSEKWGWMLPIMKVIAFEPDSREFCKLKSESNVKYLSCALCNEQKDLTFYVTKGRGKSSIFKPNMSVLSQYENCERFKIIQEEIIPSSRVSTLDSVVNEDSVPDVDFIKLDTQGSELLILHGGQNEALPKIFGVQIEVEFIEIYKNQPLFRDVDGFMNDKGFQLIDLRRAYWKRRDYYDYIGKGELIFGDALYFKKISIFRQELSNARDRTWNLSKIFKGILVCLAYRIFDYAVAIAKVGLDLKHLSNDEYGEIILHIKECSSRGILSKFNMNPRLYNMGNVVLQRFRPPSYLGWADGDREIGNIKAD